MIIVIGNVKEIFVAHFVDPNDAVTSSKCLSFVMYWLFGPFLSLVTKVTKGSHYLAHSSRAVSANVSANVTKGVKRQERDDRNLVAVMRALLRGRYSPVVATTIKAHEPSRDKWLNVGRK
jgi:hypothetical protein